MQQGLRRNGQRSVNAIAVYDFQESTILESSIDRSPTKLGKGLLVGDLFNLDILERLAVLPGMVSSRRCLQFKRKEGDQTLLHESGSNHLLHPAKQGLDSEHTLCISVR